MISDIAVIGAGPVGMLCALASVQRGFRVAWFNQVSPGRVADDRLLALSPRSMHICKRLSVHQGLPVRPIHRVRVYVNGQSVMQLHCSQFSQPALGYSMTLADFEQALLKALERQKVILKTGYSINEWQSSVQDKNDHLVIKMQSSQALETSIKSRLLLLATGSPVDSSSNSKHSSERSNVPLMCAMFGQKRHKSNEETIKNNYALEGGMRNLYLPHLASDEAHECFIKDGVVALIPGAVQNHEITHKMIVLRECQSSDFNDDGTWHCLLEQAIGGGCQEAEWRSETKRFVPTLAFRKRVVQGRIAWLGNAAQTVSPVGGQGLNMGIADVWYCINQLADGGVNAKSLQQFERQRRCETPSVLMATHLMTTAHRWPSPLFSAGLGAFRYVPALRQWLAARLMYGKEALWTGL